MDRLYTRPEFHIRPELLNVYFRTEALEKPAEVFRKVHTPIDRIKVELYREGRYQAFVAEEQIAEWVLNSSGTMWGNRIFTITGETGSGKSELCQAIRFRAQETKGHVPILISRSMTRLRDIVSLLHQHLGEPEPDDIGEITALPPDTVRHAAVTECLLAVEGKAFERYTAEQREKLRRVLQDHAFGRLIERAFARYQNDVRGDGGRERVLELMNYDEFVNLMAGAAKWLDAAAIFPYLRSRVNEGMKRLVSLGDLSHRLRRIAEHYQKQSKRPVLIMEDLTSFGFVKEDLLNYLFDLSAGNFDVVIGWTTGFEAEQILNNPDEGMRSYMMDRMKGRFLTTSQDTRGSYFLETNHLAMIRRYLEAVREPSMREQIPDPYYPLNPYAVTRIYNQLIDQKGQQKRTPRQLIDVIRMVLQGNVPPWQTLEEQTGMLLQDWALDDRFFALQQKYPEAVLILKWYGRPHDFKIDRRTIEILGVSWPEALRDYLSDETIWSEDEGKKKAESVDSPPPTQDKPGSRNEQPTPEENKPPQPTPPPPQEDPTLRELQHWLSGKGAFPSRQKLKAGLSLLVNLLENHTTIANPRGQISQLRYEKEALPIIMLDTNDTKVEFPAIILERNPHDYPFYRACLNVASPKDAEAILYTDLRLAAWVGGLVQKYQQRQRAYLTERIRMPIEAAVFHAYRMVKTINDGIVNPTSRAFSDSPNSSSLLARTAALKQLPNLRNLMERKQTIFSLYRSFFFINSTTADRVELEQVAASYSFEDAVSALNGYAQVDVGFKVTTVEPDTRKELALHQLLLTIRQAGGELISAALNLGPERSSFRDFQKIVGYAEGMRIDMLKRQIDLLKELATRHKVMDRPQWAVLSKLDPALDFDELTRCAQPILHAIGNLRSTSHVMAAHRAISDLEEKPTYQVLTRVQEMLHAVEETLAELTRRTLTEQERFAQGDRDDCREAYETLRGAM